MILLLTILAADAGKLAGGFRGVPFGAAAVLDTPPIEGCATTTDPIVRWGCTTTIGAVPVTVYYLVEEGYFSGVAVESQGSAHDLLRVMQQAYGTGAYLHSYDDSILADRYWVDGDVIAVYKTNEYSSTTSISVGSISAHDKIGEIKKAKAAQATGDL